MIVKKCHVSLLLILKLLSLPCCNHYIMKYSELERLLKKSGCYVVSEEGRHPTWFSPKSGKFFQTSHHKAQEVKRGTLRSIIRDSGIYE